MTQDEIISMAVQAGISKVFAEVSIDIMEAFAKLVAAAEREACANLMFDLDLCAHERKAADAIRARGEA